MGDDEPERGGFTDLFEDLEQQAAGLHLADRDAEVADRARGEYAAVTLADRVHASVGRLVRLTLAGGLVVEGHLTQAGTDWCLVSDEAAGAGDAREWVVRLGAAVSLEGLSARAVPEGARPAVARLGFGAAARRVTGEITPVEVRSVDGTRASVRVVRVGADFLEVTDAEEAQAVSGRTLLVPFVAVAALRSG